MPGPDAPYPARQVDGAPGPAVLRWVASLVDGAWCSMVVGLHGQFGASGGPADPALAARGNNGVVAVLDTCGGDGAPAPAAAEKRYILLVPLKSSAVGKSRLSLEAGLRSRLAQSMALDTVTAAAAADRIAQTIVLVDDEADGRMLQARVPVHVHLTAVRGLNEAIREGAALSEIRGASSADLGLAVLPADLPSLHPDELDAALGQAARRDADLAVVADRQGTGTTLLVASRATLLTPHYGAASLRAHRDVGAWQLTVPDGSGLRRDVDEWSDVADVTGRETCAFLAGFNTNGRWGETRHGAA